MIWESDCGMYRVVRSRSKFCLPTTFYAQKFRICQFSYECWDNISRHRERRLAERACQKHADHHQ